MKRTLLFILIISVLVLSACSILGLGSKPSPTPTPTPTPMPVITPTPIELKPHLIEKWSGTDNMITEPFTIASSLWLVSWAHSPEMVEGKSNGYLQIIVYNAANTASPVAIAADAKEPSGSISYISENGTFYLLINAANTQWTAEVQAYQEEK